MYKHIIMSGATSAVGGYLLKQLYADYKITTIGRKNADIICDFAENEIINLPQNSDAFLHIASVISAETDEEILNMYEVNVKGILKCCIAANRCGIKHFIYISSISAVLDYSSKYYTHYSISKKQSEDAGYMYCKMNGMHFTVIRPSQIYGSSDLFRKNQPLIYRMADMAERGQDITIYGKKDAIRNYIHIDDVVKIIQAIISKKMIGSYNIVHPCNLKLSTIAEEAFKAFDRGGGSNFFT